MQIDTPTKRRPRPRSRNRPQNPNRSSEKHQDTPQDPFAQPDPFKPIQQVTPGDPFQSPFNTNTPPRSRRRRTGPASEHIPAFAPRKIIPGDPFQEPKATTPSHAKGRRTAPSSGRAQPTATQDPFQSAFGVSRDDSKPASFGANRNSFGQNTNEFAQNSAPFAQNAFAFSSSASSFGQNSSASNHTSYIAPFGQIADPFSQPTPSIQQTGDPFAQQTASFGQKVTPFGQRPSPFGQKVAPFGQSASAFFQSAAPDVENAVSVPGSSSEVKPSAVTPLDKRLGSSSFTKPSFNYKVATQFQGMNADRGDIELERESDVLQATGDAGEQKSTTSNQLLLKSVPLPLFSRAALQRHFSSVPGVHVTYVSLRGSRRPDSRRTALITFSSEQQASMALRNGQSFKGTNLQLSLFRQSSQPDEQHVHETNELFFNYVPESLFSEESIKQLFDIISKNTVTKVSLKERPHYGSMKRTAIITFTSAIAAATALRNLPLYKGRALTVAFRRGRPQSSDVTAAPTEQGDTFKNAFRKGSMPKETQEDEELQDISVDLPIRKEDVRPSSYDKSKGDDADPGYLDMNTEEEDSNRPEIADRQTKIAKLKAEIRRKEMQRAQMIQGEEGRREKKAVTPKRHETSLTEQEATSTGWRKVGEKINIKNATKLVGACMSMCPFKEFEDRIIQRDISLFETDDQGDPAFTLAVKKYRRSAAISEQPSPNEVRPPEVLLHTMEHLKEISDSTDAKFVDVHNFVRDRTRSLRQDFTLQGIQDESCIKIHEESVRFHILSEHRLYGTDPTVFSSKQNLEQLDKCLISLREMYDILRDKDLGTSPNEPEMQAYYILTQMSDPKTCVQLCTGFAQNVRCSRPVQFALEVVRAASEGFGSFTRYFSLVRSAPYLMACLMHSRFSVVRTRALAVINVTHGNPNSRDNIPVAILTKQLGFESDEEAEEFCRTLGMKIENLTPSSMDSEVITIRTPSEGFDEAKAAQWESSRADILIESKALGYKTSEIICGSGCDDFKSLSPTTRPSKQAQMKKVKAPAKQTLQFQLQVPPRAPDVSLGSTDLSERNQASFAPNITRSSRTERPSLPREEVTTNLSPQEDHGKARQAVMIPPFLPNAFPRSPKQRKTVRFDLQPPSRTPAGVIGAISFSGQANSVEPQDGGISFVPGDDILESKDVLDNKFQAPYRKEQEGEGIESSRKDPSSTTKPVKKPTRRELEKAARRTALKTLLMDLARASEVDLDMVRRIIDDAQTGALKFPKAMEAWDDAKDILQAMSEKTERGLRELEGDDYFESSAIHGEDADIEGLREKLRFCSSEGTELWDQLDETFSKSLAAATAQLKESGPRTSATSRISQVPPTVSQLDTFDTYNLEDDDASFEIRELPDRGAEVRSILAAMNSVQLRRWQAVIVDLTSGQTGEDEMGIAKRWLWQRLSAVAEEESGSLCLLDAVEGVSPSLSIREVKEVASIPYTADVIILPCDIRTMECVSSDVWTSLEQVLRENRSTSLSYGIPVPSIVILYYRGSSDMPLWFTDQTSGKKSFAAFQKSLQEEGCVATCQKLELPRTSASQSLEYERFTGMMNKSVHTSAQGLMRLGGISIPTNLRDYLVHIANCSLGAVSGSLSVKQDASQVFPQIINKINESWKDVARRLRREEARYPKEMEERVRLAHAYTSIDTSLQLPLPKGDASIANYISSLAAVAGMGIPTIQHLESVFSFCTALGHLMNPFVCQMLITCPVSVVYLSSDPLEKASLRKLRLTSTYFLKPSETQEREERSTTRYASLKGPQRKTKRLRDEFTPSDNIKGVKYPLRRRLSAATVNPTAEEFRPSGVVANRRRSLPASYGRRRMLELMDVICSEEQAFDDMIKTTMDVLTAKRRRLEHQVEVLAT